MSVLRWSQFYRDMKSTKQKKVIVPKYLDLLPIWRLAFKPTHVTNASLQKHKPKRRKIDSQKTLEELLTDLINRDTNLDIVWAFLDKYSEYNEELIPLLTNNLKLGLDVKSMNNILIECKQEPIGNQFAVCLAQPFTELDFISSPWYIMRKYDGLRCVLHFSSTGIKAYTRNGNLIGSIQKALNDITPPSTGFYLDSEIVVLKDNVENFTESLSRFRQNKIDISDFHCIVFDMLSETEFESGESTINWSKRMGYLNEFLKELKDPRFVPIDYELYTEESFGIWQKKQIESKWEGLILRKDTTYKNVRTSDLLKVKQFQSLEAVVKDITVNPERKVMKGAIIQYKNNYVTVGSGWTEQQRKHYVEHPEELIGKTIEVNYFREFKTKDQYSLQFPTLKAIWGEKRDI